jgi:hypothetical protein
VSSSSAAYIAAGPDPTMATVSGRRRACTCAAGITEASFEVGGSFSSAGRSG